MKDAILSHGGVEGVRVAVVEAAICETPEQRKIPGIITLSFEMRVSLPDELMESVKEAKLLQRKDMEVRKSGLLSFHKNVK